MDRVDKAHSEQDQIGIESKLAAWNFPHHVAAILILMPFDLDAMNLADLAVFTFERSGRDAEQTLAAFLVRGGSAQLIRPIRPSQELVFLFRWLGQDL